MIDPKDEEGYRCGTLIALLLAALAIGPFAIYGILRLWVHLAYG